MAKTKLSIEKLKRILLNYSYDPDACSADFDLIMEILVDLHLLDPEVVQYPKSDGDDNG